MINDKAFRQEGGEGSANYQAENMTINNGLNYSEVRQIAIDVFNDNFPELSRKAAREAAERAEYLIDRLLTELKQRAPGAINTMQDPGMQHALFTAQVEYAKSGDKDLGEVLVDILVDRAAVPERSLTQIVLD